MVGLSVGLGVDVGVAVLVESAVAVGVGVGVLVGNKVAVGVALPAGVGVLGMGVAVEGICWATASVVVGGGLGAVILLHAVNNTTKKTQPIDCRIKLIGPPRLRPRSRFGLPLLHFVQTVNWPGRLAFLAPSRRVHF